MRGFEDFCTVFKSRAHAAAFMHGSGKYPNIRGSVFFYQTASGVLVRAEFMGLPIENDPCKKPIYAFHIHSGSECAGDKKDPFAMANGHFNPHTCPHPYHAGDMPPLFNVKGTAFSAFFTDRFTIPEILGRAIILHAKPDDFTTQPSGNAGEKMACGLIKPTHR